MVVRYYARIGFFAFHSVIRTECEYRYEIVQSSFLILTIDDVRDVRQLYTYTMRRQNTHTHIHTHTQRVLGITISFAYDSHGDGHRCRREETGDREKERLFCGSGIVIIIMLE
jgi:hypothetical protein